MSGRPGSNRPPSAWKADALPNELLPLNISFTRRTIEVGRTGFEPVKTRSTDLQSVLVGRLSISPKLLHAVFQKQPHRISLKKSRRKDSNHRPADYKSAALPAELHRLSWLILSIRAPQFLLRFFLISKNFLVSFHQPPFLKRTANV